MKSFLLNCRPIADADIGRQRAADPTLMQPSDSCSPPLKESTVTSFSSWSVGMAKLLLTSKSHQASTPSQYSPERWASEGSPITTKSCIRALSLYVIFKLSSPRADSGRSLLDLLHEFFTIPAPGGKRLAVQQRKPISFASTRAARWKSNRSRRAQIARFPACQGSRAWDNPASVLASPTDFVGSSPIQPTGAADKLSFLSEIVLSTSLTL